MLKQKSFISFAFNILSSIMGFVSVFFIARLMGPSALGAISAAWAFTGLFAIFGDLGFGIAHYKRVSEQRDLEKCVGTFLVIRIATTIIMILVTLAVLFIMKSAFGRTPLPEELMPIFYIVLLSTVVGNMMYVITYTFTARVEKAKEWGTLLTQKFFVSFFRILVAVSGLGIIYLAWSNLLGAVIAVAVALYLFRNIRVGKPDKDIFRSYVSYAVPSLLIGVTENVSMNIDKVFISYFWGISQVGFYTSAQSLIVILSSIGAIFFSVLLPTYSTLHAEGKMEEIRRLSNRVERYISLILTPLVCAVFFFADPIRQIILGPRFADSTPIIRILVLNAMLVIFTQPYSSQIMGTNRIRLGMFLGVIMLGTNVIMNLVLIPRTLLGVRLMGMGALGSALSLLLSSFVGTILFRYYAFRTSGARPNFRIFIHIAAAFVSFGGLFLLRRTLPGEIDIFSTVVCITSGSIVYIILTVLCGELKREDLRYYLNMINPRILVNYVTSELKS